MLRTNSVYVKVIDGDSTGNNPCKLIDSQGFQILFWGNQARKLGFKKGMVGRLVFIRANSNKEDINGKG